MRIRHTAFHSTLFGWIRCFGIFLLLLIFSTACCEEIGGCGKIAGTPGTSGAKLEVTPGTDPWKAHVFDNHVIAWGSLTPNQVKKMTELTGTPQVIVNGGYVTTDALGVARVIKGDTCAFYVFQTSKFLVYDVTIKTCDPYDSDVDCSRDSVGGIVEDTGCGITLVLLPTDLTFTGTAAIIIEYRKLGAVLVIVAEGKAHVTPKEGTAFDVEANKAAYTTTSDSPRQDLIDFFGFSAHDNVDFSALKKSIEDMDPERNKVPQIQTANLVLLRRNLQIIPLSIPYQLGLQWLNPDSVSIDLSRAISQYVPWNDLLNMNNFADIPLSFKTQEESWALQHLSPNQENAITMIENAGFSSEQKWNIIIGFDEKIPGLMDLANAIGTSLTGTGLVEVSIKTYDPEAAGGAFLELSKEASPVLILGGF